MIPFSIWVMGYGGGAFNALPINYGSGKSPMDERVKIGRRKKMSIIFFIAVDF